MIGALLYFVIYLAILAVVIALLLWLIDAIPLPQPLHQVARIAIIVIAAAVFIILLLQLAGVAELPRPALR